MARGLGNAQGLRRFALLLSQGGVGSASQRFGTRGVGLYLGA